MAWQVVQLSLGAFGVALAFYYWTHCALPAMNHFGVAATGRRIAMALTAALVVAAVLLMVAALLGSTAVVWRLLLGVAMVGWLIGVGALMWPNSSFIVRRYGRR